MAAKKVLLFIVEGQSDEAALDGVLSRLLSDKKIRFHVVRNDITTRERRGNVSIITLVNEQVMKFMTSYHLLPKDILQVVHLMDTDGAFVPESAIIEDSGISGFEYTRETITAPSKAAVRQRNATKSSNMLRLAHMGTTYRNIPYEAYYCSRNLEHVLHDIEENCSSDEKMRLSDLFDEQYKDSPAEFLTFISSVPPAVPCYDYDDSWNYISQPEALHSLERGCNLHILLNRMLSSSEL